MSLILRERKGPIQGSEGWKVKIDGMERGGLPGLLQVILPVVVTKEISNTEKVDPYTDF